MQQQIILKAVAQGIAGVVLLTILIMLLLALRKDAHGRRGLTRSALFAAAMLGLWSFFAFAEAYVNFRRIFSYKPSASTTQHGRTNTTIPPILQLALYARQIP